MNVYLFIGQDNLSKDVKLKDLKSQFLNLPLEKFNLDMLYGKDARLKDLQEKLLCLPVKSKKRMVVIKDAELLKEPIKEFIVNYVKKPYPQTILVLDISRQTPKDEFCGRISRHAQVFRFKEVIQPNTFSLSRQIEARKPAYALRVLKELLIEGERPERILGGLRYALERNAYHPRQAQIRLKLLLRCDIDIKTGRLKPSFALEKLIVDLCCLTEPFH